MIIPAHPITQTPKALTKDPIHGSAKKTFKCFRQRGDVPVHRTGLAERSALRLPVQDRRGRVQASAATQEQRSQRQRKRHGVSAAMRLVSTTFVGLNSRHSVTE